MSMTGFIKREWEAWAARRRLLRRAAYLVSLLDERDLTDLVRRLEEQVWDSDALPPHRSNKETP